MNTENRITIQSIARLTRTFGGGKAFFMRLSQEHQNVNVSAEQFSLNSGRRSFKPTPKGEVNEVLVKRPPGLDWSEMTLNDWDR